MPRMPSGSARMSTCPRCGCGRLPPARARPDGRSVQRGDHGDATTAKQRERRVPCAGEVKGFCRLPRAMLRESRRLRNRGRGRKPPTLGLRPEPAHHCSSSARSASRSRCACAPIESEPSDGVPQFVGNTASLLKVVSSDQPESRQGLEELMSSGRRDLMEES